MDSGNNRIQRWTLGASYGVTLVSATSLLGNGKGISFNSFGELIVADYSTHRIVKFPVACCEYCFKSNIEMTLMSCLKIVLNDASNVMSVTENSLFPPKNIKK